MKNKKGFIGFLIYVFVLFFTITGFIVALNNAVQIKEEGGETNSTDGVTISKTIAPTDTENFFDITLEVETNSSIQNITKYPDLDVVIVMDISNTMREMVVDGTTSRYNSAIAAAKLFINKFKVESDKSDAHRKIGFVAFNTDVHKIFDLQQCTSSDCVDDATSKTLIKKMEDSTGAIINATGYSSATNRFTNLEGGLTMAYDMLNQSTSNNKYVIVISDGMPTTYLNNSTTGNLYDGYIPVDKSSTTSSEGKFAYTPGGLPCWYGPSYSDRGAIKARNKAQVLKDAGMNIMVVGTGISELNKDYDSVQDFLNRTGLGNASLVDADNTEAIRNGIFEIGNSDDISAYVNWLSTKIATGNQYYNSDASSLPEVFESIFNTIEEQLQQSTEATWVANDPMGGLVGNEKIEFVGFYDDANPGVLHSSLSDYNGTVDNTTQSDTATYNSSTSTISWNLKNSTYHTTRTENVSGVNYTYYKYIVKYRVRLKNEINGFVSEQIYKTNGTTTLSYVVLDSNGVLSDPKSLTFQEPSVVGYLGEFSFTKKSSYGDKNLKGAKFKLEHKADCTCHNGYIANMTDKSVTVSDKYATSDENGLVSFTNIPSGHQYTLTEVEVPKDHIKADDYDIVLAYGVTTGNPDDNILVNTIKTGNLEITKRVEGNDEYSGKFKFKLEIDFDGSDLTDGPYEYKIIDGNGETVSSGKSNFASKEIELEKDQTYIIYKLPVGAVYTLQELTTNGYKVKYAVNSNEPSDLVIGDKATCNSTNSCRIENGGTNEVLFVNIAGYILPATGSSGMLIMTIIGLLLLIVPVIYIGYSFYKTKRRVA